MIIDITVTLFTATATATAVNDIAVTVVLNDEVVNPEATFCERVDDCLNIPTEDGSYVLTIDGNTQTWSEYSPSGAVVIEKTKADFLSLVSGSDLVYPATYKITDIDAFTGVFISTTSADTFSLSGSGVLLVPDYTPSGVNLGQMNANDIPSVGAGERVIWGDHYWENDTASPVTPVIVDQITLTGLAQIAKVVNEYTVLNCEISCDTSLNITKIVNAYSGSSWFAGGGISEAFGAEYGYKYCPINGNILSSDLVNIRNYKGSVADFVYAGGIHSETPFQNQVYGNSGKIGGIFLEDISNEFNNNNVAPSAGFADAGFSGIKLFGASRFNGNTITGVDATMLGFELWDNCEALNNELNGEKAAIWDLRTGENCQCNGNVINGSYTFTVFCGFADIDQMQMDELNDNTINGDGVIIEMLNMLGYSKFNNNTFNGDMSERWSGFQMLMSEITGTVINANNIKWHNLIMSMAKIQNATDIQIQSVKLSDIDLDLTGFTADIINETIESGKGWFTIEHNFTTSPLTSGSSVLYNLVPNGARMTSLTCSGSLTGTSIKIGLQSDDEGIINVACGLLPITWNGISNAATANRSLKIQASGGNITGGILIVKCEFVI